MFEENELLTETFVAHTHIVPDTDDVLANVEAIARTHRRNRWVLRASGAALATGTLVFGTVALPGLVSSSHHGHAAPSVVAADGGGNTGAGTGTYSPDQEMTAFFDAGYDYNDAAKLAQLWNMSMTFSNKVKAKAGLELLEGQTLPVPPSGQPAPPQDKAVETFFNDGYGYDDAVKLAGIWHVSTSQAKIKGGTKLENGETLPVQPTGDSQPTTPTAPSGASAAGIKAARAQKLALINAKGNAVAVPDAGGSTSDGDSESPALVKYFDAGYDYNNAVQLGKIWNQTDITQIKTEAGQKLLDGETLPVQPDNTPAPPDNAAADQAVTTFFNDGYDYNDAVKLGKIWNVSSYQAKIEGGKKLEAGETLPVQPGS